MVKSDADLMGETAAGFIIFVRISVLLLWYDNSEEGLVRIIFIAVELRMIKFLFREFSFTEKEEAKVCELRNIRF